MSGDLLTLVLTLADLDDETVRGWERSGLTFREIADRLATRSGRPVTADEVARWLRGDAA